MVKKIKKMKYGTEILTWIIPALYIFILALCEKLFPTYNLSMRSQFLKFLAGIATALFIYTFHRVARELPEIKNIKISAVHLLLFAGFYALFLLLPGFTVNTLKVNFKLGFFYGAFAGHSSIIGAWIFIFVMEIVRSIKHK